MQTIISTSSNVLPFGYLLLNKENPQFNAQLELLQEAQDIIDDFKLDENNTTQIDSKLALVYVQDTEGNIPEIVQSFAELAQDFFEVSLLDFSLLTNFSGSFGNFRADFNNGNSVEFAQAVMFAYEEDLLRFKGVYNVADFDTKEALLKTLQENLGVFSYKDIISYKEDSCQYHHRRQKHCAKCVDVCPTFGVLANDSIMELAFSQIDCIACGACIGVCPTNCLEYEELPKEGLGEIIELYKEQQIFLCATQDYLDLSAKNLILPDGILPLVLPNLLMLNENDLLAMLQISGKALLIYTKELSSPMLFLNHITQAIYKRDSVILVDVDLKNLETLQPLEFPLYFYKDRYNKPYRESFAQRVQFMIKDSSFGLAKSVQTQKAPVFYGDIAVDASKCTLCLSCVGACNVNAIFARSDDFSLRFNPSLCTTCGYCITSCPENVMVLSRDGMMLEEGYFKSKELAKDEAFLCVECGKAFSTKKSIDKVIAMLGATFSNDPKKLRAMQCCPDCKVRVMFGN